MPANGEEMDDASIRRVVRQVMDEERERHVADLDDVAVKTMATILTSFGIDEDDKREIRADFVHLRKWRKSVEQAQSITFKVAFTVIVTGLIGAFWLGVKAVFGK